MAVNFKKIREHAQLPIVFRNPVLQTPFECYWREAVDANTLPTIFKLQMECRRPLGIVFLVYCGVIVVADKECSRRCLDLEPGVACDDCVFSELGGVDHDVHLVFAFTVFYGYFNEQVMVVVPDIGDFHVVTLQFLCDFFTVIDTVLEVTAALDFPVVVDAATGSQASNDSRDEKSRCELCENC